MKGIHIYSACLKNNNRKYSIYNFISIILQKKKLNEKFKKNIINIHIYKKWSIWRKENFRLNLLFKEYLFGFYEDCSFNFYLKHLGHYFIKPIKYDFMLTNNMKIKVFLWTSPIIVKKEEDAIIELRTFNERINDILKNQVNFFIWKSLKFPKKIPRLLYNVKYN